MDVSMTELQIHFWLVLLMFVLAAQTFVMLLLVNAPYGRFSRAGWGPAVPARLAWVVFESPAVVVFALVYLSGDNVWGKAPLVLFAVWQFHYLLRTFVFPIRMHETGKRIPIVIVAMAVLFNVLNAYLNARWISHLGTYPDEWLVSAPFLTGIAIFIVGWSINQHADSVLFSLRKPGETHYAVPRGGMYRLVSCPNYLGEMLEWAGWAVMTWSLAGTAFAVFTAANLLPRAIAIHRWYQAEFPDYPESRKAVIPYLL